MREVTDESFGEDVLQASKPTVVDSRAHRPL
jgi:hypothetical protein